MRTLGRLGILMLLLAAYGTAQAQTINQYTVKRAPGKIILDGKLNEPGWKAADFTQPFVVYNKGTAPKFPSKAKMLWDDKYLYIAFVMTDEDVWGATSQWKKGDKCLCLEEVAEVFIDPDDDTLNYLEIEINPLKAVMDLSLDKEFAKGGTGDYTWDIPGLKIGVSVDGTLNNQKSKDKSWIMELAFPFDEMAVGSPTRSFPPKPGDLWRINLYRYDYGRDASGKTPPALTELSAWNPTVSAPGDKDRGFHAPDRFGKIVFSEEKASVRK